MSDRPRSSRYRVALFIATLLAGAAVGGNSRANQALQTPAGGAGVARSLSPKDRTEAFEGVWKTINERYYDPSFNGVDWRAIRDRYRPLIEQAGGDEDFYRLLKQMVGELHDAHTRFHTPEERREREHDQAISIGLSIFDVEGKTVVTNVEPDSEAARAGVEEGMLVLEIDGKPIAERLAEARARVAGSSSERAIRLRIHRMIIDGAPGTTTSLRLAGAADRALNVTLTRRIIRDDAVVTSRRLTSGIAFLRLTLWKSPVRKQFKKALKSFRDAPGLIIDLRGNPGGEAEEVVKIASYFFDSHVAFGKFSSRAGRSIYLRTDDDEEEYKGPVAILVNEGSGSGSELFAGVMQENGRAVVIGRQSCGCVLGISKFRKFGEGELALSEFSFLSPGGKTLEGTGVVPNKIVDLKIADLQQHRDAALEEAERHLKTRASKQAQRFRDGSFAFERLTRFAINL